MITVGFKRICLGLTFDQRQSCVGDKAICKSNKHVMDVLPGRGGFDGGWGWEGDGYTWEELEIILAYFMIISSLLVVYKKNPPMIYLIKYQ